VNESNSSQAILKFLKFLNRLRLGHRPIFVEYEYDFKPRWQDGGNPFIREALRGSKPPSIRSAR
jgi:hypothetical protein